jgi:hypothetical protein
MQRPIAASLLLFAAVCSHAQSGVAMFFNRDPATLSSQIQTDSAAALAASPATLMVVGLPANTVDCGNATTGPAICTSAMTTFDNHLKAIAGTPPNSIKIGIIFNPANGGAGVGGNNAGTTPAYVFTTAWAGNALCVGCSSSAPLDVAFCNNYQGSPANGWTNSAVGSNVYNINTYPTGGGGTWDSSGAPLVWEAPWEQWYTQLIPLLIQWYENTSIWKGQMGYFRWGVGIGGESVVACPNVFAGTYSIANGGTANQTAFPQIALTENVYKTAHNVIYAAVKANSSGFVHAGAGIYGSGRVLPQGDGTTPGAWALDDALSAVTYGLGTGAESLAGNTTNGDQIEYALGSICSSNWCAAANLYSPVFNGGAPFFYMQSDSPSNPSCLLQPATCGGGNLTGSLLTILPFGTQRGVRLFEIPYLDFLCAYSANGSTDDAANCGSVTTPYAPYQIAMQNAQNGVPSSTAATAGKSVMMGNSVLQ